MKGKWKGYKAVRLHNLQAMAASFQENYLVIDHLRSIVLNLDSKIETLQFFSCT